MDQTFAGQVIEPSQYYLIDPIEENRFINNVPLIAAVSSGVDIIMARTNDGLNDITDPDIGMRRLTDEPRQLLLSGESISPFFGFYPIGKSSGYNLPYDCKVVSVSVGMHNNITLDPAVEDRQSLYGDISRSSNSIHFASEGAMTCTASWSQTVSGVHLASFTASESNIGDTGIGLWYEVGDADLTPTNTDYAFDPNCVFLKDDTVTMTGFNQNESPAFSSTVTVVLEEVI